MEFEKKYRQYKRRCKEKGMQFKLSLWKFSFYIQKNCYICNKKKCGGLDRIDNNIGYTEKNVSPCCFDCNRLKANKTVDEFKQYLARLNPNHPLLTGFNKINNYNAYEKKRKHLHKIIMSQLGEAD